MFAEEQKQKSGGKGKKDDSSVLGGLLGSGDKEISLRKAKQIFGVEEDVNFNVDFV